MGTQREIIVCRAQVVWMNPDYFPGDKIYLYVSDDSGDFMTQGPLEDLANFLIQGIALRKPLFEGDEKPKINYNPPCKAQLIHIDGYFGRPPVPAELLRLYSLEPGEIDDFKRYLEENR